MSNKTITVDFDLTLADTTTSWNGWIHMGTDGPLTPIKQVHDLVKEKSSQGYDVHIVTFREEKDKQEVIDFVKEHNLPIKSVICTAGKDKTPILQALRSELHIDDFLETIMLAELKGIKGLLVDHGQHKNNSSAELFEKIIIQ
jgi:phosphoglycolate phosphatase-like HAD superfamily hydrolase